MQVAARVVKGDKATSDADGHYLAAGLLLLEAKRRLRIPILFRRREADSVE
jgi:hypothetical protein